MRDSIVLSTWQGHIVDCIYKALKENEGYVPLENLVAYVKSRIQSCLREPSEDSIVFLPGVHHAATSHQNCEAVPMQESSEHQKVSAKASVSDSGVSHCAPSHQNRAVVALQGYINSCTVLGESFDFPSLDHRTIALSLHLRNYEQTFAMENRADSVMDLSGPSQTEASGTSISGNTGHDTGVSGDQRPTLHQCTRATENEMLEAAWIDDIVMRCMHMTLTDCTEDCPSAGSIVQESPNSETSPITVGLCHDSPQRDMVITDNLQNPSLILEPTRSHDRTAAEISDCSEDNPVERVFAIGVDRYRGFLARFKNEKEKIAVRWEEDKCREE